MRTLMMSFEMASEDMLLCLQHILKKLSDTYTVFLVKYYLDVVALRAASLELQIRLYLTHDLFVLDAQLKLRRFWPILQSKKGQNLQSQRDSRA